MRRSLRALMSRAVIAVTMAAIHFTAANAEGAGFAFSPLSLDIPALKGLSAGVGGVGGVQGL